jgi:glucose/mannose transport system permease protein
MASPGREEIAVTVERNPSPAQLAEPREVPVARALHPIRWSRWSPQIALVPAVAVTLVVFGGGILWTMYLSLTRSRRLPEYEINWEQWARNYLRLFADEGWQISLNNLIILGIGSALAIVFGFILAAMIEREKRGEGIFRTVFLYPLAVSLIVTGVAWRWILNPTLGLENFLHQLGFTWVDFNWLARGDTAMYAIILASIWQSSGFYMALMLAGLKGINSEIWSAARLDGVSLWRLYIEIIVPMMKFTFLTCAILLSLGVVKAYDIVIAMTNGGPGQSTWVPAYFTINALGPKGNLGYASAAATIMLAITAVIFLPLVLLTALGRRRAQEVVQ